MTDPTRTGQGARYGLWALGAVVLGLAGYVGYVLYPRFDLPAGGWSRPPGPRCCSRGRLVLLALFVPAAGHDARPGHSPLPATLEGDPSAELWPMRLPCPSARPHS
jgi:hypothetical protein